MDFLIRKVTLFPFYVHPMTPVRLLNYVMLNNSVMDQFTPPPVVSTKAQRRALAGLNLGCALAMHMEGDGGHPQATGPSLEESQLH